MVEIGEKNICLYTQAFQCIAPDISTPPPALNNKPEPPALEQRFVNGQCGLWRGERLVSKLLYGDCHPQGLMKRGFNGWIDDSIGEQEAASDRFADFLYDYEANTFLGVSAEVSPSKVFTMAVGIPYGFLLMKGEAIGEGTAAAFVERGDEKWIGAAAAVGGVSSAFLMVAGVASSPKNQPVPARFTNLQAANDNHLPPGVARLSDRAGSRANSGGHRDYLGQLAVRLESEESIGIHASVAIQPLPPPLPEMGHLTGAVQVMGVTAPLPSAVIDIRPRDFEVAPEESLHVQSIPRGGQSVNSIPSLADLKKLDEAIFK